MVNGTGDVPDCDSRLEKKNGRQRGPRLNLTQTSNWQRSIRSMSGATTSRLMRLCSASVS